MYIYNVKIYMYMIVQFYTVHFWMKWYKFYIYKHAQRN